MPDPVLMKPNGLEDWVTGLLANLVMVVCKSLAEVPSGLPEYVEASISYRGVKANIRVEFEKEGRR